MSLGSSADTTYAEVRRSQDGMTLSSKHGPHRGPGLPGQLWDVPCPFPECPLESGPAVSQFDDSVAFIVTIITVDLFSIFA